MIVPENIRKLMLRHVLEDLSPVQENELSAWRKLSAAHEKIFQECADREKFQKGMMEMMDSKAIIWKKIKEQYPMKDPVRNDTTRRRARILRIALIGAAAVLIVFIGIRFLKDIMPIVPGTQQGHFFSHQGYFYNTDGQGKNTVVHKEDLKLDERDNGERIMVMSNQIMASPTDYDKLIAPGGNRFCLQLPGVGFFRLNSESWVSYPAKYIQDSLHIMASGEVFVDLDRTKSQTVRFTVRNLQMRATRASFNIQYHPDELAKVTLLSGALSIEDYPGATHPIQPIILQPGQAFIYQDSVGRVMNADTIVAAAWKNGRIYFRHENILTIMQSISRWYNFDYEIDSSVTGKSFDLDLPRNAAIKTVMDKLQEEGIHYSIGFKEISIKP